MIYGLNCTDTRGFERIRIQRERKIHIILYVTKKEGCLMRKRDALGDGSQTHRDDQSSGLQ